MIKNIYHETQVQQLCGMHALNCIMQRPLFSQYDLDSIALDIEAQEGRINRDGVPNHHTRDGQYTAEVLQRALNGVGMEMDRMVNHTEYCLFSRFLVQRPGHWFAVAKIGVRWLDLDSQHPTPVYIPKINEFFSQLYI